MSDRFYWLAFSAMPGIGPIKFQALIKHFGSAKDAWVASLPDLKEALGEVLTAKFERFRNQFSVKDYTDKVRSKKASFLILTDKEYPKLLKEIPNPPFVLYVKGEALRSSCQFENSSNGKPCTVRWQGKRPSDSPQGGSSRDTPRPAGSSEEFSHAKTPRAFKGASVVQRMGQLSSAPAIAVVGTRKITQYGRDVTRLLTEELVNAGFTIVSGLAFGVDSVAHQTAVENNGKTIAVLGCGADCCFPSSNQPLYNSIVEKGGAVISEFPLGQPPQKGSFPSRNRIIAGLSLGVLVTEGDEDSGALITADYALKFGRKVFAVPGPITSSLSKGPHKLLSKGAKLVVRAEDILKEFKMQNLKVKITMQNLKLKDATKEELEILKLLENEALHFDEIVKLSKLSSSKLGSILSIMEMKGLVRSLGGVFSIQ